MKGMSVIQYNACNVYPLNYLDNVFKNEGFIGGTRPVSD